MITRRSFLQALMGLPAIAALPAVGKVVEELPFNDPPELSLPDNAVNTVGEVKLVPRPGVWLYLNDYPVHCMRIAVHRHMPSVISISEEMRPEWNYGLPQETMEAEFMYDPGLADMVMVCAGNKISLRADFQSTVLRADAYIKECYVYSDSFRGPMTETFTMHLMNATMHES